MKNLLLVFALLFFASTLFSQTATQPSGSGTSGDPYQIATLNNLYWIIQDSSLWNKNFIQTADIDASTSSSWDGGAGFSPIGDSTKFFNGSYDGQGYKITGLFISRSTKNYIGLFGRVWWATIKNLKLDSVKIIGNNIVGGLIGYHGGSGGTLINCHSSGSVTGVSYIGGLIGSEFESTVSNCSSSGSVTGVSYIGGLIGSEFESTVSNCSSTGSVTGGVYYIGGLIGNQIDADAQTCYSSCSVTGGSYIGGLIGYQSTATIENCYSIGSVTGGSFVGGLIGEQWGYYDNVLGNKYSSTATHCYSSGSATGTNHVGGLIGYQTVSTTGSCLWDVTSSGQSNGVDGFGETTTEMKSQSTFTGYGWNFTTVWSIDSSINNGYPYLKSNMPTSVEGVAIVTPETFSLLQNYPNPFNPSTNISFSIPTKSFVSLRVFDLIGREVATIVSEEMSAGSYTKQWIAANMSSGIYFYRLQAGSYSETKKLILLK